MEKIRYESWLYTIIIVLVLLLTSFLIDRSYLFERYSQLNETYILKAKEYTLLHNNKLLNLSKQKCINFELYIRFNESGVCFRPLNQLNNSKIQEIHNLCNQDLLVRCIQ